MRRSWLFIVAVCVVLAACTSTPSVTSLTSSSSDPAANSTAGSSGADGEGDSPFGPGPAGVTVADAFTAVLVQVANPPTFPVAGTDGRFHVAYNVLLVNASRVPASIDKLEIVDAADTGKVIATFTGQQLVDPACTFGDCNRQRALPSTPVTDTVIPPQQARLLLVDFAFDAAGDAPKYVLHHLYFHGAASPVTAEPVPVDYTVTPYSLSAPGPVVIGPPVTGRTGSP